MIKETPEDRAPGADGKEPEDATFMDDEPTILGPRSHAFFAMLT